MSLSSPRLSDTEVHEPDQLRVTNSSSIFILSTQPNNIIELRHYMATCSKYNIFKLHQILDLYAATSSPLEPTKLNHYSSLKISTLT